jgi:hypothetical protein
MVKVLPCDYTAKLSLIKKSTLLIWGENDADTPLSCAGVLEKGITDCGLVTIPKAGHFAFAEAPVLTANVLKSFKSSAVGCEGSYMPSYAARPRCFIKNSIYSKNKNQTRRSSRNGASRS